jgi:hypothetical protein
MKSCILQEDSFTSKEGLNLRKKLVTSCIWNMAVYGAETGTLRNAEQKYLGSCEICGLNRMEKIIWTDRAKNEAVLPRIDEERNTLHTVKRGMLTALVTSCVGTAF